MIRERIIEGIRDAVKYVPDEQLRPTLQAILLIYDEAKKNNVAQINEFLKIMDELELKETNDGK